MRTSLLFIAMLAATPAAALTWDTRPCDGERKAGHYPLPAECRADLDALKKAGLEPMEIEADDDQAYDRAQRLAGRRPTTALPYDMQHIQFRGRRVLLVGLSDTRGSNLFRAYDDAGRLLATGRGLGLARDARRIVVVQRKGYRPFLR